MVDRYRNYKPTYYRQRTPKRPNHRGRSILFILVLAVALYGGYRYVTKPETQQKVATTVKKAKKIVKADPITDTTWTEMQTTITALLAQHPDINIGVSIIDLQTDRKVNYGFQDAFAGASTTKVLTAAAFLHDVEEGRYTLQTNLGGATAQEHLRRMLNRSNNESWAALNSAVGYSALTQYAHDNGIASYEYIGNLMEPSDQALLLEKVYKRQLVNEEHTKLMLSYMQDTNNEDMIPVVVPKGATFYHKYGQLDDRLHDGAIVDYKNRPLVLVIYTKGGGNAYGAIYTARTQMIQEIAQSVFDTFYAKL